MIPMNSSSSKDWVASECASVLTSGISIVSPIRRHSLSDEWIAIVIIASLILASPPSFVVVVVVVLLYDVGHTTVDKL